MISEELLIKIAIKHCSGYVSANVPTTEQYRKQDVKVEVMHCQYVRLISCYEDGPKRVRNASKPLMHEHNNLREAWQLSMRHSRCSWREAIKQSWCHSKNPKSNMNWGSKNQKLTLSWQWEEQALAVNSHGNLPAKKTIKYYCVLMIPISILSLSIIISIVVAAPQRGWVLPLKTMPIFFGGLL